MKEHNMLVGFVTISLPSQGDSIRPIAIRNFFGEMCIPFKNIVLDFKSLGANCRSLSISSLPFTLEGIGMFSKKILLKDKYSIAKSLSVLNKISQFTAIIENAYKEIMRHSDDIKIFHAETQVPAYICSNVKKITGIPYVFDMRGLLVEERKAIEEPEPLLNFYFEIEKVAVEEALKIIVVSNAMKDYVVEKYNYPAEKIIVVPNASDVFSIKAEYKEKMNIIYGGGFNYWERVEDYLRIVEIMHNEQCRFYLMGDGCLREKLIDYINSNYLNICYFGRKNIEDSRKVFTNMQIGLAPSTKDLVRKVASPLKIFEYASCGLPIITVDVGEWSDTVREYDCGIVVENSDPKEFSEAVKALHNKDTWERKSANGRKMIKERFNWSIVLKPLLDIYAEG